MTPFTDPDLKPSNPSSNWLRLNNVSLERGDKEILRSVSFSCRQGQLIGLLGVNGAGKTSLLHALTGWLQPSQGEMLINGTDWRKVSNSKKMSLLSFCPQTYEIPQSVTVHQTLEMGSRPFATNWLSLNWGGIKNDDKSGINHWSCVFGVDSLLNKNFADLSGGEQRRVLLARTFLRSTELVLLDEPLANLDLKGQMDLALTLRQIVQENRTTVMWSLHDWNMAMEFCDHLIVLHQSTCIYSGDPQGIPDEKKIHPTLGRNWSWIQNPSTKAPMLAYSGRPEEGGEKVQLLSESPSVSEAADPGLSV